MANLSKRGWVPANCEAYIQEIAQRTHKADSAAIDDEIAQLIDENQRIHDRDGINLNPATNIMNPRAEAVLAQGLGSRPSLGYPGDKYEMGLEAIEKIEVIAAELAAEIFDAKYAEIRVASGAMSNLYAFMATCQPGDTIIVPSADVAGHVTHHDAGAAGLYGLNIVTAPIDAENYTVDLNALRTLAKKEKPKLITIGGSLNLFEHPVSEVRAICDEVGAKLLFDAAHQCGIIAGGVWENPLQQGAHLMTMSTYKSLGGPAGGLIVTNDAEMAEALDQIAFPGLTANFDAAKSASLAISLLDWRDHGKAYAQMMLDTASALADSLAQEGLDVFASKRGGTTSHQFALLAERLGGGQAAAKKLRPANILTCGIGLPIAPVDGDVNGLRIGTPEIARLGITPEHMPELARLIARALTGNVPAEALADDVKAFRQQFSGLHFIRQ
ncbi:MAG: serine hydroxymethyltransferase [Hyphomicrobiales bacterium]